MTVRERIEQAIKAAGSEAKLASELGCSQVAVNKVKQVGRVSALMALRFERFTGVDRHYWRPDLWPAPAAKAVA